MKIKREVKKRRHRKVFQKGLSTVIVTLIIVLLSLLAVGIIWTIVKNLVGKQAEITQIQEGFFSERIDIMNVKYNEPLLNITLRKSTGQIKVTSTNVTTVVTQPIDTDLFSVVDLSGSMRQCLNINSSQCNTLGGNYEPPCNSLNMSAQSGCISCGGTWNDKLTATQDANKELVNTILSLGSSRVGLIGYRKTVINSNSTDLTTNVILLNTTINSWQATSSTCICCGINNASLRLSQQSSQEKLKSIIVMSDGEANINCSGGGGNNAKQDAIKAACNANSSLTNLVIYSIGVEGADAATLTSIANCGGGKYFSVIDTSELMGIYQGIAQQIQDRYRSLTSLSYLSVVFYNATDSYKENIYDMPDILQTKTYDFNLQGKLSGEIIRIEVYPIALTSHKEEIIGPMLDFWGAR
jgi:hypothetical protein